MVQVCLNPYKFIISDPLISFNIKKFDIKYIRFFYDYDLDGKIVLIAKIPEKDRVSLDKSYFKINIKKSIYIRLPSILKPYIGKTVQYRHEEMFNLDGELFRIRPVDFEFDVDMRSKILIINKDPYFTKQNQLVLPKSFISKNFNNLIFSLKTCFLKNTNNVIEDGHLLVDIVKNPKVNSLSFFLIKSKLGASTKKMNRIKKILDNHGKVLSDFKFISLIQNEKNDYGTLVFKEEHGS
jgi:hypothetical protein